MAGGNPLKPSSSNKPPPNHHRSKSRWESAARPPPNKHPAAAHNKSNPNPNKAPTPRNRPNNHYISNKPSPNQSKLPPFPFLDPPPPPSYGFHSLERRTVVLADGSVRSYFALPHDYQEFVPEFRGPGPRFDRSFPMSPEFHRPGPEFPGPLKRKFGDNERDGYERQRMQLLQYGNVEGNSNSRPPKITRTDAGGSSSNHVGGSNSRNSKHNEVDRAAVRKAFLHYVKLLFESGNQRKKYLANGKQGSLQCLACGRSSKYFSDTHSLIMHVYHPDPANLPADHLGLHKALCIVMGWNYSTPPDSSKAYQFLSAEEATSNLNDLIIWPPTVIIENTITGKGRDGRMEGMGNRAMDNYLRDIGIHGGKSKSLYSKDGHQGITLIKFSNNNPGLMEALQLAEHFERDNRGRNSWARVESMNISKDDDNNPNLVKGDENTKEKKRILYGYLATICDLEKVDVDTRKKCDIHSRRESERLK